MIAARRAFVPLPSSVAVEGAWADEAGLGLAGAAASAAGSVVWMSVLSSYAACLSAMAGSPNGVD